MISTIEAVEILVEDGKGEWARVRLEEHLGIVTILSSFGKWAHQWPPQRAVCLAELLSGGSRRYLGSKMLGEAFKVYDEPETIATVTRAILMTKPDESWTNFWEQLWKPLILPDLAQVVGMPQLPITREKRITAAIDGCYIQTNSNPILVALREILDDLNATPENRRIAAVIYAHLTTTEAEEAFEDPRQTQTPRTTTLARLREAVNPKNPGRMWDPSVGAWPIYRDDHAGEIILELVGEP